MKNLKTKRIASLNGRTGVIEQKFGKHNVLVKWDGDNSGLLEIVPATSLFFPNDLRGYNQECFSFESF